MKRKINEALGVPENIINSAIKLYDYIFAYVSSLRQIDSEDKYRTQIIGDFRIADMNLRKINLKIELYKRFGLDFTLFGMGKSAESKINSLFQMEAVIRNDEIDLMMDLGCPESFEDEEMIEFLRQNRNKLIPIIAHELKHGYDTFKKRTSNLHKHVDYVVFSEASFGRIKPLTVFLFNSYYIHNIENLVRPTEMAADIELRKTTPKEFYKFFVESEIFKTLKKIKESTFEELRDELMNYESQIDELLATVNESYNDIDEKVDRILKLFYFNVVNWKNDKIESYIYPMGVNNPLFQYFQTKDNDNYLNNFYKKTEKYANDYVSFYKNEEKYMRLTATNMIKKLGRLYEMTYINIKESRTMNNSIWDWDMYHQLKGTKSEITNKIKPRMLGENDLKKIIKRVIDDMDKKSPN
jgi:hypothetical protein